MNNDELDQRIDAVRARIREIGVEELGDHWLAQHLARLFEIRAYRISLAIGRRIASDHGAAGEVWPGGAHPSRADEDHAWLRAVLMIEECGRRGIAAPEWATAAVA